MRGYYNISALIHETGHGLGNLAEGPAQRCNAAGCVQSDYADIYSSMGNGWASPGQFSTVGKQRPGWIGGTGQPRILTVTTSGDYQLDPYERGVSSRVVALRVNAPTVGTVDVEARVDGDTYRQNAGVIAHQGDTLMDMDRDTDALPAVNLRAL
jgi:hypothetical protein